MLAFAIFTCELLRNRINLTILWKIFKYGVVASVLCITATLLIDTYFWREHYNQKLRNSSNNEEGDSFYMWPELQVLYYNTVLNKSHEWGTSPWHWYFLVALPKSVTIALPCALVGLVYQRRGGLVDW